VLVGTNDLARGGCSEEAVLLGILRTAEEIHARHPDSVVVLQGILPRSHDQVDGRVDDGARAELSLATRLEHAALPGHHASKDTDSDRVKAPDAGAALSKAFLWPSIRHINLQLEHFCSEHDHFVYFDASELFLTVDKRRAIGGRIERIERKYMPDFVHPSAEGQIRMGEAIVAELDRIITKGDETNDVVSQRRRQLR